MDACRGKNCKIKRIHRTCSSCHRWWNKICRQLISVTNCRSLVFDFKVFLRGSGNCGAGPAARVQCLSQVAHLWVCQPWLRNDPHVQPAAAHTLHAKPPTLQWLDPMDIHPSLPALLQTCPSANLPFRQLKPLFPFLPIKTQKFGAKGAAGLPLQALVVLDAGESPAQCRTSRHRCHQLEGWALCGQH